MTLSIHACPSTILQSKVCCNRSDDGQAPETNKPHVYLVHPEFPPSYWGMEHFIALSPYSAVFPPLGLLTLAGLTPPEFPVTLCDENAGEEVNFDTGADIVGITGYIIQIKRVFEIADQFRALGKTVVLGGPLANLLPEECRPHCDVLFEGESEYTWPRFLRRVRHAQVCRSLP